ncbi:No apical meristem-associated C-terminal domain-containing protein [Plasmodiophora brassicae]|uniref:No apical meristem-associated C-terminal domain-containing protein n=1 Tax=Plasmodiophora brassicae TaxID=37360 RepID=A0A0G4IQK7_PLABS|nr:hypothetical protein PBRA_000860 [Plasmodiophora brassicae]SPQ97825.1 unnamed protein product [Plasmodiophora brassicae]
MVLLVLLPIPLVLATFVLLQLLHLPCQRPGGVAKGKGRRILLLQTRPLESTKMVRRTTSESPLHSTSLSMDLLLMCATDGQQPDVDGDGVDGVADQNSAGIPNLALAQRPSIGKKKAKNIKFEKEQTNEAPLAMLGQWMQQMAKAQEDRLSVAREKTRIARNKFLTSLFTEDDQEHSEFIRLQREQALLEARLEVAKKRNELAQWEERH